MGGNAGDGISGVFCELPREDKIKRAKAMAEGTKRLLDLIGDAKSEDEIEDLSSRISDELEEKPEYSKICIHWDLDDFLKRTTKYLYLRAHKAVEGNTAYKKKSRHGSYKVHQKYENGPLTIEINEIKKQFASVGRYSVMDYTHMYFPVVPLPNKFAAKFVSLITGGRPYEIGYTLNSDVKVYDGNKLVFNAKLKEEADRDYNSPMFTGRHWPVEDSFNDLEFTLKTYVPNGWEKKLVSNNNKSQGK